jgi:hypothetical protein
MCSYSVSFCLQLFKERFHDRCLVGADESYNFDPPCPNHSVLWNLCCVLLFLFEIRFYGVAIWTIPSSWYFTIKLIKFCYFKHILLSSNFTDNGLDTSYNENLVHSIYMYTRSLQESKNTWMPQINHLSQKA